MKKVLAVAAITATMLAVGTGAYAATYVNGVDVTNEVFTTISNDYTLFPVRYLGEKLGCDVSWNPNDKCISVSKGDIHRDFYNGSAAVYDWNGNSYNLVTAPKLVDGNTMVPAEFYRDKFGVRVIWDDVTSSLFINSEDTYNKLINTDEYRRINKYNKLGYVDVSGRTIAQVAEDAGMDLQEFLEEYDLPADMPGDTTESAAYNCISVSKMAEIYDMDFDTIKKVLNFPNSVNKDTAWGVAIGQVKLGDYIGEDNLAEFKDCYGFGDEVTANTLWGDVRQKVDEVSKQQRIESEKK